MKKLLFCIAVLTLQLSSVGTNADTITLISGNAPIGQVDPMITVGGSVVTLGGVTYPSAQIPLQQASVISPWATWTSIPGCAWVGVANGGANAPVNGYVYRTSFLLPSNYSTPTIGLTYSSDNYSSAYLNGFLLGSTDTGPAEYTRLFSFSSSDPEHFVPGVNVLEFRLVNGPGPDVNPSGLIFSAQVAFTEVPEPSPILALLCGVSGIGVLLRGNRKLPHQEDQADA